MNYALLPEHIREGMQRYIEHGVEPGSFLRAALENDLVESFACADADNLARMFDIVKFLYNECPMVCRGSKKAVADWIKKHKAAREAVPV